MAPLQDQVLVHQELTVKLHAPWIAPSHPAYKWWVTATVMLGAFLVVVAALQSMSHYRRS